MLITERKFCIFNIVNVFFSDDPDTLTLPDYDFLTLYSYKNWGDIKGFERNKFLTTTIDLSQDFDAIWNKINRQHKRHIRRAEKNGINIIVSNNYEEFFQMHKKFLIQKKFADPIGLYFLPPKFIQEYGTIFIAEKQGEKVGGSLYFNNEQNALLVSSVYQKISDTIDVKRQNIDANCYIQWEAMQYFKNLDVINFDFGGDLKEHEIKINHQMAGGDYFKRCFGGDITSGYQYRKFSSRFNKLLFHSWNFLNKHY